MTYAIKDKHPTRYTKAPISQKTKPGGINLVSQALVKPGVTNLTPKLHVKRGDTVILVTGPKKDAKRSADEKKKLDVKNIYKGQTGKVLSVSPTEGKIVVEGINMLTHYGKQAAGARSGLSKKEGAIFASRVMLYCSACKKPTRIKHKIEGDKKARVCRHCSESFDG
jgi:large subunit ribosomal protein L24